MRKSLFRSWRVWVPVLLLLMGGVFLIGRAPSDLLPPGQKASLPHFEGGVLRVGAPEPVRQASVLSPYGPGFEFELVASFCASASCTPEWVYVADKEKGFAMLRDGQIDVLVGFWGSGPDQEAADPEQHPPPKIVGGSAYAHFNPVRITGAGMPRPESRSGETDSATPAGKNAPPALDALARTFASLLPSLIDRETSADAPAAGEPQSIPVFSLLEDGGDDPEKDIFLLDPASYALWRPFMGDVSASHVKSPTPFRWFWRDDGSPHARRLGDFWASPARKAELAELTERYFGFLPSRLRQRDILELAEALTKRLPEYEKYIMKASRETGVPPLLLVAAIYQESRFDPSAVSETNVRGIMQLTTATAKMLGVDRKDPEQCIMGGARYLRDLWERIGDKADNDWDRWFMALAAYNQGMSNLNRVIGISQELGDKGNTWADLKRAFPLSTTCRGREARSFVEKIRYYNFILHGLVALAPAETQDFAPLLGLAVAESAL